MRSLSRLVILCLCVITFCHGIHGENPLRLCSLIKINVQQCGVSGVDTFVRGNYKKWYSVDVVTNSALLYM